MGKYLFSTKQKAIGTKAFFFILVLVTVLITILIGGRETANAELQCSSPDWTPCSIPYDDWCNFCIGEACQGCSGLLCSRCVDQYLCTTCYDTETLEWSVSCGTCGYNRSCELTCSGGGCLSDDQCAPDDGCNDYYCDSLGACRAIDLCPGGEVCGNGVCEIGETNASCPSDCPPGGSPNFNVDIVQAPGIVSIEQGQVATYDINIAPSNNYSGTVNLTVSGCPATATCAFSAGSVTFTNNSPNPGISVLTVSNTANITPGTYSLTVTGTDTAPDPDLISSDSSDLTVNLSRSAVCDNTWRNMPDSTWVNWQISAAQDNSGVFLYWPLYYRDWPYYSGGFIQNKCVFGGSVCLWQRSEMTQGGFSGINVYAQDPNNVFVRGDPNCQTYWGCPGTSYTTLKFSPPWSWTDMGDISKPWGTPTSVPDKDGRLWQFQTVPLYTGYKAQYRCSSPVCTTLTYRSATSGFSINPAGPAQASLSVAPNTVFYTFVDYGQPNDSIIGPSVGGSYACAWDNAWLGTAGRFKCTAPASGGSYTYATGTVNYPLPGSNICASGPTNIGALTVVAVNQSPAVPSVTVTEPDYCTGPGIYVNWTYSDPDGDPQSAYQVQIDDQGSAWNAPYTVDSGKISGSGTSYFASGFAFNTTYKARVRVWDSRDAVSSWKESGSWKTPKHAYPYVDFTYSPLTDIPAKQPVQFTDQTVFYDGGGSRVWNWLFRAPALSPASNQQNPNYTYNDPGSYSVSLTATDKDNYSCSRTKPLTVAQPVPVWKEVSPR